MKLGNLLTVAIFVLVLQHSIVSFCAVRCTRVLSRTRTTQSLALSPLVRSSMHVRAALPRATLRRIPTKQFSDGMHDCISGALAGVAGGATGALVGGIGVGLCSASLTIPMMVFDENMTRNKAHTRIVNSCEHGAQAGFVMGGFAGAVIIGGPVGVLGAYIAAVAVTASLDASAEARQAQKKVTCIPEIDWKR